MASQNMTNRTLSGLFWMTLATGANVVSLLLVLIVLARLLTPADFGLAAAALMVIGFSAIFADFGVGPVIVQRSELRAAHIYSGFTLSILFGALLGGATWLAAPAIAAFFQLAELSPILRVLSLIFPLQGFGVAADSLLQRELRFRALAILDVITFVVGYGVIGITLAVLGFAAWALVGAHLAQVSLRTVLMVALRPHPIWPLLERQACLDLLKVGGGFTASRFSNYFAGQAEYLVIGRCLGPVALGVYGRAYQLMAGPAVLFGNILDRVLFPTMVHVQHQQRRLAEAYRRDVTLVALVILPVSAIVVSLAPEVVHLLLGPDWNAVVLPLQILGVGMLFRTSCKISDALVRATGAVYRRTWRQTAYAITVLVGAWIGTAWGVEGVAIAVLITLALNFFLMAQLALRLARMSWLRFATAHLAGFGLAAVVGAPVAAAAILLRTFDVAPLGVLATSLAAVIPSALVVVSLPRIFLGRDGMWMVRKVLEMVRDMRKPRRLETPLVDLTTAGQPIVLLSRRLSAAGVRYCRWKAHADLERILSGAGDLDLLVERSHAETFLRVAEEVGFTRVVPCFERSPAQELHLYGLDQATGTLLHLHINFELLDRAIVLSARAPAEPWSHEKMNVETVRQEPRPPGFHPAEHALTPEEFVLRHCTSGETSGPLEGMPVTQSDAEAMIFVLRTMEQYARLSQYPRLAMNVKRLQAKLQAVLAAGDWRTSLDRLPANARPLFGEFVTALERPTSWFRRYRLARRLQTELGGGQRACPIPDVATPVKAAWLHAGWWRLRHGSGTPKQLKDGGKVIAIVGPDASGKSTMVSASAAWLGQVFRVEVAHLGKPPSTWLTWLPNVVGRLLGRLAPRLRTFHQRPAQAGDKSSGQGLLYRIRAVLLAWDRRALAARLARKKAQGWLIVCDRYPTACVGAPDSARLRSPQMEPSKSWLHALLARMENRLYRDIADPDIVVRLSAPLELALNRNRERIKAGKEGDDFVAFRHNDFFMPPFGAAQIVVLDTSTTQQESLGNLRRQLWQGLCQRPTRSPAREETPSLHLLDETEAPEARRTLIVEFIGVTGVGKSTLIAAVIQDLVAQGLHVGLAEDAILGRFGLACPRHPKLGSLLLLGLSLLPFGRFFLTRDGARLLRLAFRSITGGMDNLWVGGQSRTQLRQAHWRAPVDRTDARPTQRV